MGSPEPENAAETMHSEAQSITDMITDCEQALARYDQQRCAAFRAAQHSAARSERLRRSARVAAAARALAPAAVLAGLWGTLPVLGLIAATAAAAIVAGLAANAAGIADAVIECGLARHQRQPLAETESLRRDGEQWPGQYEYWADAALLEAHCQTLLVDVDVLARGGSCNVERTREEAASRAAVVAGLMQEMNTKWTLGTATT